MQISGIYIYISSGSQSETNRSALLFATALVLVFRIPFESPENYSNHTL